MSYLGGVDGNYDNYYNGVYIGVIWGHRDNGKDNRNYYIMMGYICMGQIGRILMTKTLRFKYEMNQVSIILFMLFVRLTVHSW